MKKTNLNKFILLAITFLLIMIAYCFCCKHSYMLYHTNDDKSIQDYLSGFVTGKNDPAHPFISIFLGYPLSLLYRIAPNIQWWYVYSHFMMIVGGIITIFVILSHGYYDRRKQVFALCLAVVFVLVFFIPAIASTSFTIVPVLIGSGIIAIVFSASKSQQSWKLYAICCLTLFFLSFFHRRQCGMIVLIYVSLSLLYISLKHCRNTKKAILRSGLAVFGVLALAMLFSQFNRHYKSGLDGNEYVEYNVARAEFTDYPTDSYDDNPSLYQAIGWSKDTYIMAKGWCFVDKRINADTFHYIHEKSKARSSPLSTVIHSALEDPGIRALCICVLLIYMASFIWMLLHGNHAEKLIWALNLALTASLLSYQVIGRRFIYRSIVVVFLPTVVMIFLLMLNCDMPSDKTGRLNLRRCGYIMIVMLFVGSVIFATDLNHKVFEYNTAWIAHSKDKDDTINQYFIKHKNNTYITQMGLKKNLNPRLIYPKKDLKNVISWGGSSYNNHTYKTRLNQSNIKSLDREAFLKESVFLVSPVDNEKYPSDDQISSDKVHVFYAFYRYMQESYPNVILTKIDTICPGAYVYQFRLQN